MTHVLHATEVTARPLGNDLPVYSPPANDQSNTTFSSGPGEELTEEITLRQALSLALMHNPELAASIWDVRSGEARIVQAALFPNPEIDVEVENFGGSREVENSDGTTDSLKRFDEYEATFLLSQLIEIGGKRSKRKQVATSEHNLLGWDFEAKRLDTITEVTNAFIDLLGLQERMILTDNLVDLSQDVFNTVSERVKAGKVSPVEETRAQVALSTIQIEQERVKRELEAGRNRLAATWGSNTPGFQRAAGDLETITALPPYESLVSRISQNPDIARWDVEIEQREAALSLEKAQRLPDLTIAGGVRYLDESDDQVYVMGMSLPLPFFNRNQGAIREASNQLQKAREERTAAEVNAIATLDEVYQTLLSSHTEVTILRDTILPGAESAFNASNEGYLEGKFSYLDVLDVQRSLFDADDTYINSLVVYHKALTSLERLIGEDLSLIETQQTNEKE
ncbi:MAG: TolC family protein [Thermodesulfobacteriota bacterium]|nr:TolC family protein [Thermodesulfobacteriota bacterium]